MHHQHYNLIQRRKNSVKILNRVKPLAKAIKPWICHGTIFYMNNNVLIFLNISLSLSQYLWNPGHRYYF